MNLDLLTSPPPPTYLDRVRNVADEDDDDGGNAEDEREEPGSQNLLSSSDPDLLFNSCTFLGRILSMPKVFPGKKEKATKRHKK